MTDNHVEPIITKEKETSNRIWIINKNSVGDGGASISHYTSIKYLKEIDISTVNLVQTAVCAYAAITRVELGNNYAIK